MFKVNSAFSVFLFKLKNYDIRKIFSKSLDILRQIFRHMLLNSYSQFGEDLIVEKLLNNGVKFYLDIGANDPYWTSNTKRFYLKGASGINIEPNARMIDKFNKCRKRDINLNFGIGNKTGSCSFFEFIPTELSTFSQENADTYIKKGYFLVAKREIEIMPLSCILNKYLGERIIDFMSIDVEGFEMECLRSNNWDLYKPKIICIEAGGIGRDFSKDFIEQFFFLTKRGYSLSYYNGVNAIYSLADNSNG